MNEKMPLVSRACQNISSEAQELANMLRFGRAHSRFFVDNIVKAQLQPLILPKGGQLWRHGDVWIKEREHMAGANTTLLRELREAADRDSDRE